VSLSDERPVPPAQSAKLAGDVSSPEGKVPESPERRLDPRAPLDEPASVKILHPVVTSGDRLEGRAVNLSRSGLKLRIPEPMLPGTMVQVRFMDRIALGEIRYCIPTGQDFYVGVRFQDVMEMP
jgi:hypothetical protein